jgi:benzoylformate decarboxylase
MPDARVTNTITGRDAFLRVLSDEGVVKMFANPGTTELPIMHALSSAPEMGFESALKKSLAKTDGPSLIEVMIRR